MPPKEKRVTFSLKEKQSILNRVRELRTENPEATTTMLARQLKIPRTSLSKLLKDDSTSKLSVQGNPNRKRLRNGSNPKVELALRKWFELMTSRGVRINGPILMEKSKELASKLGSPDFKPSNGWLSRWKKRNNIVYKKASGEKASANNALADEWKHTTLGELLSQYDEENIYNADETGLYYRATPDGSLTYRHQNISGYKKAMDRVTVLCCTNMAGTDKKKIVLIGKSANPRCFKGIQRDALPVTYFANRNAWMTAAIFTEWLSGWNDELVASGREVLLFIDNCSAHPSNCNFSNINLQFLPPNTTSILQPLDMGIIKNFKVGYRALVVGYILSLLQNELTPSSSAHQISAKIDLRTAAQMIADSWRGVTSRTIRNCFIHSGFVKSNAPGDDESPDGANYAASIVNNYDEFVEIDSGVQCYAEEDTNDVDEIVETIIFEEEQEAKSEADAGENSASVPERESKEEALSLVARLRSYVMHGDASVPVPVDVLRSLDACYDYISQ